MNTNGIGGRSSSTGRNVLRFGLFAAALAWATGLPAVATAANGSWTQVGTNPPYNWSTAGNWLSGAIADGANNTATFNSAGLTGPFTVTLDTSRTLGGLVFGNPTNLFGWTIDDGGFGTNSTLQTASGSPTITVNNPGDQASLNLNATINVPLNGASGFTKAGTGTLTLTSAAGYSGPTLVTGGTLVLDSNARSAGIILPATTDLTVTGSSVNFVAGPNVPFGQSFNSVTVGPGANFGASVASTGLLTVNMGAINRNVGGTFNLSVPNATNLYSFTTSNSNTAGTLMGGWATIFVQPVNSGQTQTGSNTFWATVSGTGAISAIGAYVNDTWAVANNTQVTLPSTATLPISVAATNSLRYNNGSNAGMPVNLAAGNHQIVSGGILITRAVGAFTATSINGPGTLTAGTAATPAADLVVNNFNPFNTFTISAPVVDNPINGPIGLTIAGVGTTILSATNTYTGVTSVGGGTLLAQTTGSLPGYNVASMLNVASGGTLSVSAGTWTAQNVSDLVTNNGTGFAAGSSLGFDVATGSFSYGSVLSGALGVTKSNAGTLTLTAANSFTGVATVSGGILSVGTLANSGSNSPLGAGSSVALLTGGVLQYTGASTSWNRTIALGVSGGGINVNTAGANLTLSGSVLGQSGLTVTGPGTLTLSGTNTYVGPTVVASGTVAFSGANSVPAGAELTVFPGATAQFGGGAVSNIASLSGGGTVSLGTNTTLTIGADTASGVFQGNLGNGGGATTVVKNGAGVQVFAGSNTYTGGTTVNTGTIQVSPQTAAANPLGTGIVTLTGAGGATQATLAFRQVLPLTTSGYNKNIVVTSLPTTNAGQVVTSAFDGGQTFYVAANMPAGTTPITSGPGGMPPSRYINPFAPGYSTTTGPNYGGGLANGNTFILQPYTANNTLQLTGQQTGTLAIANPGSFQTINVLEAAGNGATSFTATLNFSDNSTTVVSGSANDWFNGTPYVIGQLGRYAVTTNAFDSGAGTLPTQDPRLYQFTISLAPADQAKTLNSITFQNTLATTAGGVLNVFGLNGLAAVPPTTLTYTNGVTVTADSTLEASGYTTISMGAFRVGANTVTVNGTGQSATFVGSTLKFTGTTFTGAPTFNVATGVTLGLGTVTDGNAGFGLIKTGAGTLTITSGTSYSANSTVAVNGGTLLVNQPSGLPQDVNPGAVSVAGGATLGISLGAPPLWQQADIATVFNNVTFAAGAFLGLDVAPSTTVTYSPAITAPVGILKSNGGTLILSATNSTYTGPTSITGGILSVTTLANGGSPSSIGQSPNAAANLLISNGAILQYTGATVSTDRAFTLAAGLVSAGGGFEVTQAGTTLTITGAGSGPGVLLKNGPGTLILSGNSTNSGGTTINGGTLQVGAGGTTGSLGAGTVSILGSRALAYNLSSTAIAVPPITGAGTGGVSMIGTGNVTLAGNNTYTGPTTISSGTLSAGSTTAFGSNSAVTTQTGGTLSTNGFNVAIGSLAGTGGTVNDGTATPSTLTIGGNNTSTSYGGAIVNGSTGALALVKVGTGTLTLSGANTYTGGTTINGGNLIVSGGGSLGTGPVTLGNAVVSLTYSGSSTSSNAFGLNGGTMSVGTGATLTLNGGPVTDGNSGLGGYLGGNGTIATGTPAATPGGTQFGNVTSLPTLTIAVNNGADRFLDFVNGGKMNVAAGLAVAPTLSGVTNQSSGTINVGASSSLNVANFQTYGVINLAPGVPAGASVVPTQMVNTGTSNLFFNGGSRTFIATPQTADPVNPRSYLDLHGQSAVVAGGLLVNNGLIYDSTFTSGVSLIADYGALIKGAGAYGVNVQTQNGGRFQTGNSPGAATHASLIFGPGGIQSDTFQINNATGVAGPSPDGNNQVSGWSLHNVVTKIGPITTPGTFTWNADSTNQLQVALQTLLNPTTVGSDNPGAMANFNLNQAYSWTFVQWAGTSNTAPFTNGYAGPTTDAALNSATLFDSSAFVNDPNVNVNGQTNANHGTISWHLDTTAKTLSVIYSPPAVVPEPGTLALTGLAGLGMGWLARRRRNATKA